MSFSLEFGQNLSENNMVDKSISPICTLTGVLRDGTSIIDPQFLVEAPVDTFVGCNYVTVPEFGRSYFVRNIESYRSNLTLISCHVDVLTSFASEIRANKGIVRRQENSNAYNLYIDDGSLVAYQDPYVLTEVFPSGFSGACFVLVVAGSGQSQSS